MVALYEAGVLWPPKKWPLVKRVRCDFPKHWLVVERDGVLWNPEMWQQFMKGVCCDLLKHGEYLVYVIRKVTFLEHEHWYKCYRHTDLWRSADCRGWGGSCEMCACPLPVLSVREELQILGLSMWSSVVAADFGTLDLGTPLQRGKEAAYLFLSDFQLRNLLWRKQNPPNPLCTFRPFQIRIGWIHTKHIRP